MDIATCFSPSWSRYAAIGMHSFLKHNPGEVRFHLLSDELSPENETRFDRTCECFGPRATYQAYDLRSFYLNRIHSQFVATGRFSPYTLYKLAIPAFIAAQRVLFIDSDVLCVQDIGEFFYQDLGGNLLAGCIDIGVNARIKAAIGLTPDKPYVNAGVLLLDLSLLRQENHGERWCALSQSRKLNLNDQCAINMTCSPRINVLPPKWNSSASTGYDDDAALHHYAGIKSPWCSTQRNADKWYKAEHEFYQSVEMPLRPPNKIPRQIAYCWFGGASKPPKIQACIASWSTVMPGCEITELNESNCDVRCNAFASVAYDAKKWAFVSDYFRMKWMYEHGGISLDADVELLRPLDGFLHHGFFTGQEINNSILVTATMGSEPGHPLVGAILDYYATATFNAATTKPNTDFITKIFNAFIVDRQKDGSIILEHDGHLYPQAWFCNYNHRRRSVIPSPNAHAIHHFAGSWK